MEALSDPQRVVVALWAALSVLVLWYGLAMGVLRAIESRKARQARQLAAEQGLSVMDAEYLPPPP